MPRREGWAFVQDGELYTGCVHCWHRLVPARLVCCWCPAALDRWRESDPAEHGPNVPAEGGGE